MAKFGHVFISGTIWIAIAAGIGVLGSWMTGLDGVWCVVGWLLAMVGWGFAVMSAVHLWRITSLQIKGMRMVRDDPEGFARLSQQYDEAMRRGQDER